jgi:hypothetical protein
MTDTLISAAENTTQAAGPAATSTTPAATPPAAAPAAASQPTTATTAPAAAPTDATATAAPAPAGDQSGQPPARVVPEKYEFKFADGAVVDPTILEELTTVAKGANLTQTEAQAIAELGPKFVTKLAAQGFAQLEAMSNEHKAAIKADPLFAGANEGPNLAIAQAGLRALDPTGKHFGELAKYGLGNSPLLLKALHAYGKTLQPDGFVPGGDNVNGGNSLSLSQEEQARRMYPTHQH